ncbi:B3/B4 domain-containing protein [Streptomyces netropsis]|uniref:DNA/RNA-binding domain of Phe-tRNA-synthetase-like protein n=1 Tax=Streptomyces netropsis TaxID=55404 RepID=A0A7W7LBH5_STRNE|nr:phenylalanine--tRNA ligase beta subunit-related protein [Streptomyces netropsis]MBB4887183.1 DNA/RNA-binding domain of Phe-tRNA-synthetase-like protein [Streptomyces netropsis]
MTPDIKTWLDTVAIDPEVRELRPDYRALVIVAEGLRPGPSDDFSEELLAAAEATARAYTGDGAAGPHPHVAAWREAFRDFGAKPQRTRPSVDGLLRRVPAGLPRVDRLTDIYNAISVAHAVPLGGEDLDHYRGSAFLTRADGTERFETTAAGEPVVEHPEPGEVVWRDDAGVTCRRWNWRQCTRTRLSHDTTRAVFILDALAPLTDEALAAAGEALVSALVAGDPGVRTGSRLV